MLHLPLSNENCSLYGHPDTLIPVFIIGVIVYKILFGRPVSNLQKTLKSLKTQTFYLIHLHILSIYKGPESQ